MHTGHFLLGKEKLEQLSPKHYGYWLIRWSNDNAVATLNQIVSQELNPSTYSTAFKKSEYYASLQLIALYAACYWVFAVAILTVPTDANEEMKHGLDDGINDLRNPLETELSSSEESYFRTSFRLYIQAILDEKEHASTSDPSVIRPEVSLVSQAFFEQISIAYSDLRSTSFLDRSLLAHQIAEIPPSIFAALQDEIVLTYIA